MLTRPAPLAYPNLASMTCSDEQYAEANPQLVSGELDGPSYPVLLDGACYVELAGDDSLFFVGDTGPLRDTIEEFVTGRFLAIRSIGCCLRCCSPTW